VLRIVDFIQHAIVKATHGFVPLCGKQPAGSGSETAGQDQQLRWKVVESKSGVVQSSVLARGSDAS
jgi:hypothetical protein